MDCGRVCWHERIELTKAIGHVPPVESGGEFADLGIHADDVADVAVIDLLVVVVFDLHDLVARREGPTEPLDLALAGRVKRRLQFDVERARADAAAVHRAQDLDVTDGIEPEASRDSGADQLQDPGHGDLRVVCRHEVEVAPALWLAQIGDGALIDAVCADYDLAAGGLAEDLGEADHRDRAALDHVGQHLTRPDGWKLVDVADHEQGRASW